MAVTTGILYANSNTADPFRSWVGLLFDGINASGWARVAGMQRTEVAALAAPTSANQVMGYVVFRTSTAVGIWWYLKLEFGSGSSAGVPAIWATIGSAYADGSDLSGTVSTRFQLACPESSINMRRCDVASGDNWLTIAMFNDSTTTAIILCVECLRTVSGTADPSGMVIIGGSEMHAYHQVIQTNTSYTCALQDAGTLFPSFPMLSPPRNITSALTGATFGITTIHPWALVHYPAMLGVVCFFSGTDLHAGRCTFVVSRYGIARTYLAPAAPFLIGDHNLAMAIRYE